MGVWQGRLLRMEEGKLLHLPSIAQELKHGTALSCGEPRDQSTGGSAGAAFPDALLPAGSGCHRARRRLPRRPTCEDRPISEELRRQLTSWMEAPG